MALAHHHGAVGFYVAAGKNRLGIAGAERLKGLDLFEHGVGKLPQGYLGVDGQHGAEVACGELFAHNGIKCLHKQGHFVQMNRQARSVAVAAECLKH